MGMISDLYNGRIAPFENAGYVATKEYKSLVNELQVLETLLLDRLEDEERAMYEMVMNQRSRLHVMELDATFVNAFRLGALLQIDVYANT